MGSVAIRSEYTVAWISYSEAGCVQPTAVTVKVVPAPIGPSGSMEIVVQAALVGWGKEKKKSPKSSDKSNVFFMAWD